MRIFFDCEFIEDGKTIDLISIGLVSESGRVLYIENESCDLTKAGPWVKANVIPQLKPAIHAVPHDRIREMVRAFAGEKPEFWAWYGAYDWVALCQLFGAMVDLPKGWPFFARDVRQLADLVGNPPAPAQLTPPHHGLNDALWTRDAWRYFDGLLRERLTGAAAQ